MRTGTKATSMPPQPAAPPGFGQRARRFARESRQECRTGGAQQFSSFSRARRTATLAAHVDGDVPRLARPATPRDPACRRARHPGPGRGRRDGAVHRALPQGADRQPGRGRHPPGAGRERALGGDPQAPELHRRGDWPPGKADARAGGARPRDVRRDAAGGSVPPLQAEAQNQGPDGARRGPAAAGRLAVERGARRARRGRRDAGGARRPVRRRRRRGSPTPPRRWPARRTSSSSACPRTWGCASRCARRCSSGAARAPARARRPRRPAGSRTTSRTKSPCASC